MKYRLLRGSLARGYDKQLTIYAAIKEQVQGKRVEKVP